MVQLLYRRIKRDKRKKKDKKRKSENVISRERERKEKRTRKRRDFFYNKYIFFKKIATADTKEEISDEFKFFLLTKTNN